MQNLLQALSGRSGLLEPDVRALQHTSKGGTLQTVQEGDNERFTLPTDSPGPASALSNGQPQLDPNPTSRSSRPLDRRGHAHLEAYLRSEVGKRSVYAQEGDVEPSEFKETVAELLKEEEYGMLRLIVPHVDLDRLSFDMYVCWLSKQRKALDGSQAKTRSIFGLPLILPFSRLSLVWMCFMTIVDLTWTAFGVPINVGFCSVDYGQLHSSCTGTDLTFGIVYTLNLLLSFNMGVLVVNGHRKKAVMDGRRVAWYYMRHGRFVLDVAATVPFVYLLVVLVISRGVGYKAKWVNVVSLIRLIRLLRLVSVSRVIYIDSTLGTDRWLSRYLNISTLYAVMVTYQILVLINLFACVLLLLAYMHGTDRSWMTAVTWVDLVEAPRVYQWYCAVYWVVTTTTTTGFGDFSPRWWAEQVVIGLAMVGGMIAFGILVGVVSSALARASISADRLQAHIKKISQVNEWLSGCHLQAPLRLRIQEYFAQIFVAKQSVEYGEEELFADLPPYLKFEVAGELALPLVRSVHALEDLNLDAQQLIAAHVRPVRAIVGQELCRQGDEADKLWLLASGRLVALRHKEAPQHITAPALVGESLILAIDIPQCRHRPWTLRAAQPCELWELHLSDLSRVVQIYPAVRLALLEFLRMDLVKSLFLLEDRYQLQQHPEESVEALEAPATQDWCELSALLQTSLQELQQHDPSALDRLCVELERANIDDGSLQTRMAELIESAMVRDGLAPEALLGLPLAVQHVVQQQQQQQHQQQRQAGREGQRQASATGGTGGAGGAAADQAGTAATHVLTRFAPTPRPGPSSSQGGAHQRLLSTLSTRLHDTHHGPAPWGITTEEALAAAAGRSPTPPLPAPAPPPWGPSEVAATVDALASVPLPAALTSGTAGVIGGAAGVLRKESSWHGVPTPPSPARGVSEHGQPAQSSGMLPLPPLTGKRFGRVASHGSYLYSHGTGGGGSDKDSTRSDPVFGPGGYHHARHVSAAAGPAALDVSRAGSDAPTADAGGSVADGTAGAATAPPPSPGGTPRRPSPLEAGEDPIAVETGVPSPRPPLLAPHQPEPQGQGAAAPLLPAMAAADSSRLQHTASGGTGRRGQSGYGGVAAGGPQLPSLASMHSGLRRSNLSRFSSPFTGISAAGAALLAAAAPHTPPSPGPHPSGGDGGPAAELRDGETGHVSPPPPAPCALCGACPCPLCGALAPSGGAGAVYHRQQSDWHASHQWRQPTMARGGSSSALARPSTVVSLNDAVRGNGGGSVTAAAGSGLGNLSIRPRPPPPPTLQLPAARSMSPSPSFYGAPTGPVPHIGSPTAALGRRSRMFGRSLAASIRANSLVRDTLMRETYGQPFREHEAATEEEQLAAASVPVRGEQQEMS